MHSIDAQLQVITRGCVELIDPKDSRARIIQALEMLKNKVDVNPKKKHGNIPL